MGRPSKKAEILSAGVAILHQRGYAVASVENITEAAGVPKGSFFNHFHSKEQFAQEALESYFLPWKQKSGVILDRDDLTPNQKLVALLKVAMNRTTGSYDGCMIGNFSLELSHQSEPIRMLLSKMLAEWSSTFETVIREGQKDGSFNRSIPPGKAARFITNLFHGAVLRLKVDRSHRAIREFEDLVLFTLAA